MTSEAKSGPAIEGWWNAPGASFSAWKRSLEERGLTVEREGQVVTITAPTVHELPSWVYRDAYVLNAYGVLQVDIRTRRKVA